MRHPSAPIPSAAGILLSIALLGLTGCSAAGLAVGAGAAAGATAAQERGIGGAIDDTAIRLEINRLWFEKSTSLYSKVNLQVQEGRVLLTGKVPDPATRLTAVRLAWQPAGVHEVINEIEISDRSSLTDSARDEWISTKLKGRLLADLDVNALNYSIETVNRSVYLMGVARDRKELDRVLRYAKDIAYVRRVVSYVRVKGAAPGAS